VQGVQALFPQRQVSTQPVIDLVERLRTETVYPPMRFLANLDKTRFAQHAQVSRDARAGNR
jgi:hypothetical protein